MNSQQISIFIDYKNISQMAEHSKTKLKTVFRGKPLIFFICGKFVLLFKLLWLFSLFLSPPKLLSSGGSLSLSVLAVSNYSHFYHILRISIYTGFVGRVFTNDAGDRGSIPGRVIPKTQKMVLDATLLKTQHYKAGIKVKWSNPGKGVVSYPTPSWSS